LGGGLGGTGVPGSPECGANPLKLAIHQPQYLPYPGFFHKLSLVDTWVVMDDAQYDKRFTNRNRILAPSGPIWITVPIDKSQKFGRNMDVRINNSLTWKEEHWKKLTYSYRNSEWFREYGPYFEALYQQRLESLLDLDVSTSRKVLDWLGIHVSIVMESELGVEGRGTRRLVEVCRAMGADTYVSGPGGRNYMDETMFAEAQIKLEYTTYAAAQYKQRFGGVFIPDLSVVDLLFNLGPAGRDLIVKRPQASLYQLP
jgi:hypothetical protein